MNVAVLVPYPLDRVPGQRFRLEQWAKPLASQGIHLEFFPLLTPAAMDVLYAPGHFFTKSRDVLAGSLARVRWAYRAAQSFDVVVVYREAVLLGLDCVERLLARHVPTVYDFDDAVWIPNVSSANRLFRRLKGFKKVNRLLSLCTTVSAGCEYLAAHARRFNESVFITPTSIEMAAYHSPRVHETREILTVGWTGSVTTGPYLQLIASALQKAARRVQFELVTQGAKVEIPGVRTRYVPWAPETEVDVVRTFDVGLKPSPKEEWVRGKCPMKDLQYMALGIPAVATRFGTALESIEHGRTGFLCDADDSWIEALVRLQDPTLRQAMGGAARQEVEARYSSVRSAATFAVALQEARARFSLRTVRQAPRSVSQP